MTVQNLRETSIMLSFSVLPDPRKSRNQSYSLFDIITVTILAVLCGADDWVEVTFWGEANLSWLQERGICPSGTPSHDTFSRFFRFIDPDAFERCFINWKQRITKIDQKIAQGESVDEIFKYFLEIFNAGGPAIVSSE